MGRFFMYATIALLAIFVLSSYVLLNHGGGSIAAVRSVTVHDLTTSVEAYNNQPITTQGLVSYSEEHGEYQLVEEGNFAIVIKDEEAGTDIADFDGERVTVSGVFHTNSDLGTYIDAHAIQAAD